MSVRNTVIGIAMASCLCAAGLRYVHAELPAQDLDPLKDDVSRAQLFEEYERDMANELTAANKPFAFPSTFKFAHDAISDVNGVSRRDKCKNTPDSCPIFGIDISHYEPKFPIDGLATQSGSFIYMKATKGTNYFDGQFSGNWKTAGEQKIPRGAYHFLSSDPAMTGKKQADTFIKFAGSFKDDDDLLPALDLEWDVTCQKCPDRWQRRSAKEIVDTVH